MRIEFLLAEAARGLRRNAAMTFAVVVTVAVSLAMTGAALMLRAEAQLAQGHWYGKVGASVFLCRTEQPIGCAHPVTDAEREAIRSRIQALPGVKRVYFENKDEAYRHFTQQFADTPQLVNSVTPGDLPESFRIELTNPRYTDAVIKAVAVHPGVDEVADHRKLLGPFLNIVSAFQAVAVGIAGVLLAVAFVLVANTVRLSAMARKREMAVSRLVGASKKALMLPFLLEGAASGLVGATLAVGVLAAIQHWVLDARLRSSMAGLPLIGFSALWPITPILVVAGVGMVVASAALMLRRYIKV